MLYCKISGWVIMYIIDNLLNIFTYTYILTLQLSFTSSLHYNYFAHILFDFYIRNLSTL